MKTPIGKIIKIDNEIAGTILAKHPDENAYYVHIIDKNNESKVQLIPIERITV